jgi:HK97 family phage prohead protease
MIYKNTSLPVADVDESKGIVTLYASAFGNVDSDGDIIEKGAFSKTIQERGPQSPRPRIKHLFQHDRYNPIGTPLTMVQDENGLLIDSKVSDIRDGDYIKLYRDGVITEHSIGFEIIKSDMAESKEYQLIKEVKLWEYSSVTWGANENTPVVGMKSEMKAEFASELLGRLSKLNNVLRNGDYTDETFKLIEHEVSDIEKALKSLVSVSEPEQSTQATNEPVDLLSIWNNL